MSHFALAVVTKPGETLEEVLQPYHQYECTEVKDQYVKFIDKATELQKKFDRETCLKLYNETTKETIDPWDSRCFRTPTDNEKTKIDSGLGCGAGLVWDSKDWGDGLGYSTRVRYIPEGFVERQVPFNQLYRDVYDFAHQYCGYKDDGPFQTILGDRIGVWTNPNAKWDWWQIGGRYSNWLFSTCGNGVDQALIKDIDFGHMYDEGVAEGLKDWLIFKKAAQNETWDSWEQCQKKFKDEEPARQFYRNQDVIKRISKAFPHLFLIDQFHDISKEDYLKMRGNRSIVTFALLYDGQWLERGKMEAFGTVANEKEEVVWQQTFLKTLKEIPDDCTMTIVDCHI